MNRIVPLPLAGSRESGSPALWRRARPEAPARARGKKVRAARKSGDASGRCIGPALRQALLLEVNHVVGRSFFLFAAIEPISITPRRDAGRRGL